MKPRFQSAVILLLTLLIGMLLGALIQSSIRSERIHHLRMLRSEDIFISEIEETIKPNSQQQADQVQIVLREHAPVITTTFKQNRDRVRSQLEVLESQLHPLLDEEQKLRLHKRLHPPRPRTDKETDGQ